MKIDAKENICFTGRFSDGSDREKVVTYDVTVVSGTKTYFKTCNIIPIESEIILSEYMDITPIVQPTNQEVMDMQLTVMDLIVTVLENQMGGL